MIRLLTKYYQTENGEAKNLGPAGNWTRVSRITTLQVEYESITPQSVVNKSTFWCNTRYISWETRVRFSIPGGSRAESFTPLKDWELDIQLSRLNTQTQIKEGDNHNRIQKHRV